VTGPTGTPTLSPLSTPSTLRQPIEIATPRFVTALSARPKPPRGGAPIPRRAAPRLPPCRASSPLCLVAPCPVPTPACHALSLAASRCCPRRHSPPGGHGHCRRRHRGDARLAHNITRSEVARPGAGFFGYTSRSLPSLDVASVCCKRIFQVFHMHVAGVSYGCCKSRSRCCIYCNGYTRTLQASIANVSAVSDGCCMCFIWVLHMFYTFILQVFHRMLQK
jgi:hypothetical protein